MRALSLTQPWASLVAVGAKRIETRSWRTTYSGPVAIHAAKGFPRLAREVCRENPFRETLERGGWQFQASPREHWYYVPEPYRLVSVPPLGVIVAVATLGAIMPTSSVDIFLQGRDDWPPHEKTFGDYGPGRYAWFLSDVRPLASPVPCRGALGLWRVPPEVERLLG